MKHKSLGIVALDSTKLRIPQNQVVNMKPEITEHWCLVNSATGEIADYKKKAYEHKQSGITTRFALEQQVTGDRTVKTFLTIGFNAKALQKDYLQGITMDNIKQVYDYIMSLDLCYFTFESFMNGEVTDTDFKKDVSVNCKKLMTALRDHAIPKKEGAGMLVYDQDENQGIQFSNRKSTKTTTAPFWKAYNKGRELKYNSTEFSMEYRIEVEPNTTRVETTVKNKKHWKSFKVTDTTLQSVLSLEQEKLNQIISLNLKPHVTSKRTMKAPEYSEISPLDAFKVEAIALGIEVTKSVEGAFNLLVRGISCPVSKSRHKKQLRELYEAYVKDTDKAREAEHFDQVLNDIGWNW